MNAPRVAMLSVGLGRVQRGFERYFQDLFELLSGDLDITLFKSGGPRDSRQRVPAGLRAVTALVRALPLGRLAGRSEYHRDCLAFAACAWPALRAGQFDVVHCIDPPLAHVLCRLRQAGGLRAPILFTEGSVMPPRYYPRAQHVHHVARAAFDAAIDAGIPAARMSLVPCGVRAAHFAPPRPREQLRACHGIAPETFVVLAVSALKREHKRIDHLIEEVARLEGDVMLWLDGNPEDPAIDSLARARLGRRCRVTHLPSAQVPELYAMADVLVHGALEESFGLVLVEALCAGLPVLAHDAPHFRWLIGDDECLVDMRQPGALARRLAERSARGERGHDERIRRARDRFDWSALKADYLALYRRAAWRDGPP